MEINPDEYITFKPYCDSEKKNEQIPKLKQATINISKVDSRFNNRAQSMIEIEPNTERCKIQRKRYHVKQLEQKRKSQHEDNNNPDYQLEGS